MFVTKQMIENRDWKEVRGLTENILCRLFSNQGETATLTLFGKKYCTLTKESECEMISRKVDATGLKPTTT